MITWTFSHKGPTSVACIITIENGVTVVAEQSVTITRIVSTEHKEAHPAKRAAALILGVSPEELELVR